MLDEPTVGVDPQSRNHIFETVKALHAQGMTVIYTSHYMEEVEALCDRVAIMDHGRASRSARSASWSRSTPARASSSRSTGDVDAGGARGRTARGRRARGRVLRVEPTAGLAPVIAAIEATGVTIVRIESRQANLETAFLALTGRGLRDAA